jgi:hypothetical protein
MKTQDPLSGLSTFGVAEWGVGWQLRRNTKDPIDSKTYLF